MGGPPAGSWRCRTRACPLPCLCPPHRSCVLEEVAARCWPRACGGDVRAHGSAMGSQDVRACYRAYVYGVWCMGSRGLGVGGWWAARVRACGRAPALPLQQATHCCSGQLGTRDAVHAAHDVRSYQEHKVRLLACIGHAVGTEDRLSWGKPGCVFRLRMTHALQVRREGDPMDALRRGATASLAACAAPIRALL